jgi:hypothetical protein
MTVPFTRLISFGGRAFFIAGPALWNSLPEYLKERDSIFSLFKRQLRN